MIAPNPEGQPLFEINFCGDADRSGEHYILIDNVKVRKVD